MNIIKIVESIALKQSKVLDHGLLFLFILEIEDEAGVVLIPMFQSDAKAMLIPNFLHIQPIETDNLSGCLSGLPIFRENEDIANQHDVGLFDIALKHHLRLK